MTGQSKATSRHPFVPWMFLPVAALLAMAPLLRHGVSCGHDLGFHVMSWLDAAQQMRHGTLYPRWAMTPAWNAGEPRFVFYPPLSWMLGAVLTMLLRPETAVLVFLWLGLAGAGFAMYRLAREYVEPRIAMMAAALYLVNPYMLFNAFERSALAELLASIWMPLLLLGVLRARPTARGIAVPLALLWLTNAPAAVMGSYLLALVAFVRVLRHAAASREGIAVRETIRFTMTFVTGAVLGLALPAFYLLPAAWERRYVQVAMAILPNMRFQDNFLFAHTADAPHNAVNHTASVIVLLVLAAVLVSLTVCLLSQPRSEAEPNAARTHEVAPTGLLAIVTVVIAFLLVPLSTPLWHLLPDLAFLQFPWRLATILTVVFALALALILQRLQLDTGRLLFALPVLLLAIPFFEYSQTRQVCEDGDGPSWLAAVVASGHGVPATDEYTPNDADNDVQRTANPGYWFVAGSNQNAPAPNTKPNPDLDPAFEGNVPLADTISSHAPAVLSLHTGELGFLVLNLRDYPRWSVAETYEQAALTKAPPRIARDDGLLAIPLPHAGNYTFRIAWQQSRDEWLGAAVSVIALLYLLLAPLVCRRLSSASIARRHAPTAVQ